MAGVSKITLATESGDRVLVDLTGDTVTADSLVVGSVAHGADGEIVEGANPYKLEETNTEVGTQADLIAQIQTALEGKASPGGGITPSGTIQITENGTHDVTAYASAKVSVSSDEPNIQPLNVTENGTYTPSGDVDGYGPVTVSVPTGGGTGEVNTNTCTVIIVPPASSTYYVARETVSEGAVSYALSRSYTSNNITVNNVRCDSVLYIMTSNIKGAEVTNGELLKLTSGQGVVIKTPSTSGASVNVTLSA